MALLAALAGPAAAQQRAARDTVADTLAADSARGPSPRSTMFRSFLLPGWGQAVVGSYLRGGVWFAINGANWYMLLKTVARLGQVREIERRLVASAADSLQQLMANDTALARRLADPQAFDDEVAKHTGVAGIRELVDARTEQRQDWITYTIFFTLMSGVDAYVNTHLRDFPVGISAVARRDGSVALRFDLPVGAPASGAGRAHPPHRW
jgi:hypothetical protein